MSRVAIKDIIHNDVVYSADWSQICDTEIVPRKMVEMIIERIKGNKSVCVPDSYAEHTLDNVLLYAESLLKRFEEDK